MSPIYGQPLSAQQFQYQLSRTPVPSRFSRQRGSHRSNIRISYGDDDDEIPLPQEKLTQQHAPNVSSAVLCAVPAYPQSQPVAANRTALNLDINHRSGALIDQTRGRQVQPLEIPESPQAFRETVAGMHQPLAPNKLHPSARLDSDNSTLQKILQEKRRSLKQPSQSSGIQRIDDSQPVNNIGLSIIRPKRGLFGAFRRKLPASLQNENVIVPYVAWLHGDDRKLTVISITDQDSESTSHCPRTELVAQQGPVSPTPSKSPERTRLPRLGSPELGIDVSRIVDSQAAAESDEEPPSKRITKRLRRPKRPLVIDDQQAAAPQDANRNDVPSDNAVECLDVANASQENAENEERTSKRQRHRKRRLPVNELELTEELHQVPSPVRTMSGLEGADDGPIEEQEACKHSMISKERGLKQHPPKRLCKVTKNAVLSEQSPSKRNITAFPGFKVLKYSASTNNSKISRSKSSLTDGFEGFTFVPTGQKASQPRSRKRRSAKQSQTNSLRFPQLELVDPNHHEVSTTFDKAPPLSPERQSHVLSDDSSATPAAGDGTDVSHRVPPHVFTEEDEPTVTTVIEELDVNVLAHILQEPSIHSEPAELDDLNANLPANKSDGGTDGPDERHTAASTEERAHAEISQAEQDTVDVDDDLDARPERLTSPLTSIVPLRRRRIEVVTSVEVEDEGPSQPAPKFIPRLKSSMREKSPDQPGADSSQNTRIGRRVTFSDDVQVTTIFSEDDDHLDREHSESESERSSDEDEENNDRDNERLGRGSHVSSIAHDDSDEESEQSDDESASSRSRASTEDIESDEEYRETSSVRSGDETSQGLDCKDSHEDFVPDSEAGSFERGLDENVAARILPVRMTRSWTRMAVDAANLQYQQDRSNWEGTGASIDSDSEDLLAGQSGDGNVLQSHFFSNGGARSAQGDEASVDEGALKEDEEMMLEVADKAAVVSDQDCLTKEAFLLRRKHNLQKVYLHKWRRELRRVVVDLGM